MTGSLAAGPLVDWSWIADHAGEIGSYAVQHVVFTAITVAAGIVIAMPIGIASYRRRWLYPPVTVAAGLLYTIPSLAAIVLLIPFTGLSIWTGVIPLTSYTLLILIRNIVAGLASVPEDAKEAARGMGYTGRQLLWRVEIPLALPVIVAGIRIATISTIGLVIITGLIGYGGLGHFIFLGLQRFFSTATIVGAVCSVALALVADGVLLLGQRALTPWARTRVGAV